MSTNAPVDSPKTPTNEELATSAFGFARYRALAWAVLLMFYGLELFSYNRSNYVGEYLSFGLILMGFWIYTGEPILDFFIIRRGIKGLDSKNRTKSIVSLVSIPLAWLIAFLIIRFTAPQ